mmetsp:Transcript_12193/g.51358  ORF Transcript_12193/g.51358 Transcript_12193/m.51358 type:complete len:237 (-) Transcript_12193:798-1508(-)
MHGAEARARAKMERTARSDSPTNLLSSSGPLMEMKLARHSFATALAASVLPQPGGPYSSTPPPALRPMAAKSSGWRMGRAMAKSSSSRTVPIAPTCAHVTSGTVAKPSRVALGCTRSSAASKSSAHTATPASSSAVSGAARTAHEKGCSSTTGAPPAVAQAPSTSMAASAPTPAPEAAPAGAPTPMSASAPLPTPSSPAASIARSSAASRSSSCLKTRASATAAASLASAMRSAPT